MQHMIKYLVGGFNAYENMSSSVGMMKIPIYGKIKNVPNHQPDKVYASSLHKNAKFGWNPELDMAKLCKKKT